jgi:Cu2+-exporting ATPase
MTRTVPEPNSEAADSAASAEVCAPRTRACDHCGLPTVSADDDPQQKVFCCNGCRQAYELIHGWGLDDYYAIRDLQHGTGKSLFNADRARFDAFDDPAYLGSSAPKASGDDLLATELSISGLHCAACAWLIENVAARTPGWKLARVKLSRHTVEIVFDPREIKLSQIAELIGRLGYELMPLTSQPVDRFRDENRRLLTQIAIAGFCAANAMWIAVALYAGDASGVAADHRLFLRIAGTLLGVGAVIFPGRTFFVSALASLRTRTPHMDLPVALGLSVGTVVGIIAAITDSGDVYFDSLAMLVFLLLVGRWIQFRQQHRAAGAVDLLMRITPQHANLVEAEGQTHWVLVDSLKPGQVIRVAAGESVPADGRIESGATTLDRSLLTGESEPIAAEVGSEVTAGTVNLSRPIDVCIQAIGSESRIGKVMQSVEAATAEKTPIIQLADRIGGVFVVVVTLLAIGTFGYWGFASGLSDATANATSLLIVACPCALALATPLALAVTLGRAAKRKILIRDASVLEHLSAHGMVWFDKTGTLTEGRARAKLVHGPEAAIADAASIESAVCHPIAEAVLAEAQRRSLQVPPPSGEVEVGRGGVCGTSNRKRVAVGNLAYLQNRRAEIGEEIREAANRCIAAETTPILVAVDSVAVAVFSITDPVRHQAAETVASLRTAGWEVGILSGDHPRVVGKVAKQIGIDPSHATGNLSPEEKLARVSGQHGQTVVMVGDGANDAAALAAADVGIAVQGGAEASLQAAPVFIASGKLESIAHLVTAARRSKRLVLTTFAVSLSYNVLAVCLAFSGYISPLLAAVLMPISSVSVLSLTLAWPTFSPMRPSDPSTRVLDYTIPQGHLR